MVCCRDTKSHGSHVSRGQERQKKMKTQLIPSMLCIHISIHREDGNTVEQSQYCAVTPSRMWPGISCLMSNLSQIIHHTFMWEAYMKY